MRVDRKNIGITLTTLTLVALVLAMATGIVQAGTLGLDRNSSDLSLDAGSLDISGGDFVTTAPWDVNTGFQISLLGEEASPPNDEWNFNHYNPGTGGYDWDHYNFADYDYYHLEIDSTGNIQASFYTGGPTGELLEWALYYTDSSGNIQTTLGGVVENPTVDGSGTFSAFLRITPANTYRTFDGTGEGFVNTVEIFNGEGKLTDLAGYQISQPGSVVGDTWTASGDIALEATYLSEVWKKYSGNPVVTGSWAFDPCVINDGGTYKMWYTHVDGSDWTFYYADSSDGITWANHQQVLAPSGVSGDWDEVRVVGPSVINDGGTYKMWYAGYDDDGVYTIGYATSPDGTTWTKVGQVLDVGSPGAWDAQMVREPWVIKDGSTYKMWYEGTSNWPQFEIGYATSTDGVNWTKHASNPVFSGTPGGWDAFQVYAPSVVKDGDTYHMYFSGTDNDMSQRWSTGYATSSDGISWTEASRNPVLIPVTGDSLDYVSVLNDGGTWKMWYSYPDPEYSIGLATMDGSTELYLDPAVASIPNDNSTTQTFDVKIANASNMYGYQFVVTFDPAHVEATAAAFDDSLFPSSNTYPPSGWDATIDNVNGKVYFARTRLDPGAAVSGSGTLATVMLRSKSGATSGIYKVDFEQTKLADVEGSQLPCETQYAWLTLYGTGGTLEGSVDLQGRSDESGGTVTIVSAAGHTESKQITAADGSWSFTDVPAGSYQVNVEMARYLDAQKGEWSAGVSVSEGGTTTLNTVKLLGGDANDDDVVDISDAGIIGGEFGNAPPTDDRADINDDNMVDILDLVLMGGNYNQTSPVSWP